MPSKISVNLILIASLGTSFAATNCAFANESTPSTGKAIFDSSCAMCHTQGIAGAPKIGDISAWEPRISKGNQMLQESALKGIGAMPPKGACSTCSESEIAAAVEYIISESRNPPN